MNYKKVLHFALLLVLFVIVFFECSKPEIDVNNPYLGVKTVTIKSYEYSISNGDTTWVLSKERVCGKARYTFESKYCIETYNKNGQKIKTKGFSENDSLIEWEINKYDRNSRLIKTKYYKSPRKHRRTTKYGYDENGLLLEKSDFSTTSKSRGREVYTYNSEGTLIEFSDFRDSELKVRDTYKLNPEGKYTQRVRCYPGGDTLFIIDYSYPADDLVEERCSMPDCDSLSFTLLKKIDNDLMIERAMIRNDRIRTLDRYEYNQSNQLVKQFRSGLSPKTDLQYKSLWEHHYDVKGKPLSDLYFVFSDSAKTLRQKTEYEYRYY
ncbi:MAG: hypothetical protein Q7J65_07205 [Candidatus Marinimicrobia bacterium]|nr:hypothetical protein [Candidatus Neomarinimicrobiota bacterium]